MPSNRSASKIFDDLHSALRWANRIVNNTDKNPWYCVQILSSEGYEIETLLFFRIKNH